MVAKLELCVGFFILQGEKKMKKIIAVAAALFISAASFALDITAGGRANFGLNIYDFKCGDMDDAVDNLKPMPGFGITGIVNIGIPVVEGLGVQPEVGFHFHGMGFVPKYGDDLEGHYMTLDIPVLVTYKYDINDKFFIQPEIGPKFSFTLGKIYQDKPDDDDADLKTPFNFGIAVGATFGINGIGPGSILVNLRYNRDFTKHTIDDDDDSKFGSGQTIDVGIGYQIKVM